MAVAAEIKRGHKTITFDWGAKSQTFFFDINGNIYMEFVEPGSPERKVFLCPSGCVRELTDFLTEHFAEQDERDCRNDENILKTC